MVTLSDLAFGCYLYAGMTKYDASYLRFMKATGGAPDLNQAAHRSALLTWLNKWGCRQFKTEYHDLASYAILEWSRQHESSLFPRERELLHLSEMELAAAGVAFESLSKRIASHKTRNGATYPVSVGPTGAAKVLFAVRPHALPPWDGAIRRGLGYDGSRASYLRFLNHIKSLLEEAARLCEKKGFRLADLPSRLGRPQSTLPKLIDEYYWVTITKGCKPPHPHTLQRWADWSC